jgi:hypothetical protein
MTKKTEPTTETRDIELGKLDAMVEQLNKYSVPELQLDKSLEECRQLNDKFEHIQVEALKIDSPVVYTDYGSFLRRIKDIEKKLEEQRVNEKAPHLEAGRVVDAKFRGFQDFATRLRKMFDRAMSVWDQEQETIRRKKEAALREKARKEQERLDRAAAKKAAKLEAQGKADEADAVREAVPQVPTPVVEQTNIPKVAGVSKTKRYKAEVNVEKQEKLLIEIIKLWNAQAQAKEKQLIPGEYWILDEKKINAQARNLKGKLELPDVRVVDEDSRSIRT